MKWSKRTEPPSCSSDCRGTPVLAWFIARHENPALPAQSSAHLWSMWTENILTRCTHLMWSPTRSNAWPSSLPTLFILSRPHMQKTWDLLSLLRWWYSNILYLPHESGQDNLQPLFDCLEDINLWMGNNFLKLIPLTLVMCLGEEQKPVV